MSDLLLRDIDSIMQDRLFGSSQALAHAIAGHAKLTASADSAAGICYRRAAHHGKSALMAVCGRAFTTKILR